MCECDAQFARDLYEQRKNYNRDLHHRYGSIDRDEAVRLTFVKFNQSLIPCLFSARQTHTEAVVMAEMVVAKTTTPEPTNVADHTQNVSPSIQEKQSVARAKSAVSVVVKYFFLIF